MREKELLVEIRLQEESEFSLPKIAEMSLTFGAIETVRITSARAFHLADDLEKRIQKSANRRFGRDTVKINCYSVRPGSLIIDVALTAIWMGTATGAAAKGAIYLLSNYAKVREGIFLLAEDLRNAKKSLYKIVARHISKLKSKKTLSIDQKEERRLEQTMGGE